MTSWGTLYYSFSLFAGPMQDELGWSHTAMNGALTCGLLVTGAMAYFIGTLLDRYGGRWIMSLGSLGAGALLLGWSTVETLPQFYALWLALGVCLSCCLIEPLFAVLNEVFGKERALGHHDGNDGDRPRRHGLRAVDRPSHSAARMAGHPGRAGRTQSVFQRAGPLVVSFHRA